MSRQQEFKEHLCSLWESWKRWQVSLSMLGRGSEYFTGEADPRRLELGYPGDVHKEPAIELTYLRCDFCYSKFK